MNAFLTDARPILAPPRDSKDGLLPPLLVVLTAMPLGALVGDLLVLHVHIVYSLVIALLILVAVAFAVVGLARDPGTHQAAV